MSQTAISRFLNQAEFQKNHTGGQDMRRYERPHINEVWCGDLKSAVAKYGRSKTFNFDNGNSYKNKQMELLAARIGSAWNYCRPYTPAAKAKIERRFRTMKDQWMASLDSSAFR